MASFVRIALAGASSFVEVNIVEGDTISRLAKRACTEFPHWGTADKLSLYLVAAGGDDVPSPSAVDSARHLDQIGWSLTRAGISSGAWLVARTIVDGGASCPCFARVSPRSPHSPPHLSSPPHTCRCIPLWRRRRWRRGWRRGRRCSHCQRCARCFCFAPPPSSNHTEGGRAYASAAKQGLRVFLGH